jgi:hypothetical protein
VSTAARARLLAGADGVSFMVATVGVTACCRNALSVTFSDGPSLTPGRPPARVRLAGSGKGAPILGIAWAAPADSSRNV